MEQGEIMKAAIFRSHYEAAKKLPAEEQLAFLRAMLDYQFEGKSEEGLPLAVDCMMTCILPVLDKEIEGKQGGRPQKELPPLGELESMRAELGSWGAVADELGVDRATIYRHMSKERRETVANVAKPPVASVANVANVAKTNEECRMKNEEGEKEEERVGQSPPAEPQAAPSPPASESLSENSVLFPTEAVAKEKPSQEKVCKHKTQAFAPPSVEEVAAYCKERGNSVDAESFVAFYASKGWMVGKNKMKDWRQAVITWEKRERKDAQAQARASPEYKTWVAPPEPELSEEERAAIVDALGGMKFKWGNPQEAETVESKEALA